MTDTRVGLKRDLEREQTASTVAFGGVSPGFLPDKELEINLPEVEDLPKPLQEQISDLLQSRSYSTQEESLEGWIQAALCLQGQPLQSKWLIISSFCIYILDCESLKLERKVNIPQVQLVSLGGNRQGCVLHLIQGGDFLIETAELLCFLTALQVIYNENTRHYIPCVTVEANDLRKRLNSLSKSVLTAFHTPDSERITSIFARKGDFWESKAFLRKCRYGTDTGFVLLSDFAVYFLCEDYSARDRLLLEAVTSVSLESDRLIIHTVQEDRVVYLGTAFLEALDRVMERRGLARLTVRPASSSFSNQQLYIGMESSALPQI